MTRRLMSLLPGALRIGFVMVALFLAGLVLSPAVLPVNAATITYTGNFSGLTDVINQPINVLQFNPSMGTLLSATFTLSGTMNTSAFAVNDGDFYAGWDIMEYQFALTGGTGYSSVEISASDAPIRVVGTGSPGSQFSFTFSGTNMARFVGQPSWTYAGPTLSNSSTISEGASSVFVGSGI